MCKNIENIQGDNTWCVKMTKKSLSLFTEGLKLSKNSEWDNKLVVCKIYGVIRIQ